MPICGICRRSTREGQLSRPLRVQATDFTPAALAALKLQEVPEAGLYHACLECHEALLPQVAARHNHTAETLPANFRV